ncbi:MAG: hypothetical protein RLZZ385_393 [Pseudomonadota bacterium]|jgi:redox-sensitive bicupin YhaK (pirin superfamily)
MMNRDQQAAPAGSRQIEEVLVARPASDGDGVKLLRVFGGQNLQRFDPFLMLDEFGSYEASDYIGGFPSHPHRGFETVTYMLEGRMEHRDHMDNVGLLQAGDVQWMKAGAGVIHSEMPLQNEGRMRGFQLWVNLPAAEKMKPAEYRDIGAQSIPVYDLDGITIKAIAGSLQVNGRPVTGHITGKSTDAGYLDIHFPTTGGVVDVALPEQHTALLYTYEGELRVGPQNAPLAAQRLARLGAGGNVRVSSGKAARVLLITGKPIGEPIVQYGPFVMNSEAEIRQAIADYNRGVLTG